MGAQTQTFLRQGQMYQSFGTNAGGLEQGSFTSELFAFANRAAGTDGAVVAAVAGKKIRVLSYSISGAAGGVSAATFNSKPVGAGTAVSPLVSLPANGFISETCLAGLFETGVGEGLSITNTTNTVGVRVTYVLVT